MQKIAIITDSTCDLSDDILNKYNIKFIPLRIIFSSEEYFDRVTLSAHDFYDKLKLELPKTSLPSPKDAIAIFEELREEGFTHIIALHLSSGLSGTYEMIYNVAKDFKDICIEVIDTKTISMGLGFAVLEAANLLQQKLDFNVIVEKVKTKLQDVSAFFVIPSLEYLRKGGRIGKVAGTIGDLMQIKPIISVEEIDGKYFTYDKVRGRKQSLSRMFEIVKEKTSGKISEVAVLHGMAEEEGRELLKKIKNLSTVKTTFFEQISPVLGVHTGPGLVGVVINNIRE